MTVEGAVKLEEAPLASDAENDEKSEDPEKGEASSVGYA